MSATEFYAIGTGLVVLGVIGGLGAVLLVWRRGRKQAHWISAEGRVVDMVSRAIRPGESILYYPVIEFSGPAGQRVQFEAELGSRPPAYRVGQTVRVLYDPADVKQVQIDSLLARWFVPGALAALSGLAILLGFMFRVLSK